MSSKTDEREISFNEWAQRFQVSTKWDTETVERKQFMEKLELALEAEKMGLTKKEVKETIPQVNHERTLLGKFQGLVLNCLNLN
jgi:hypothetical protein